ncbi:hypothetical protein [Thiofilum flexile]|uniref:hypothetical protein n=1 Tax=Thiofilum flexile TaxID=125627 RepID=UPI0003A6878B|nr:hypothetical protein [Thiofilum flexile]
MLKLKKDQQWPHLVLDHASSEGSNACYQQISRHANPYVPNSVLWHEWRSGWLQYDADYHPNHLTISWREDFSLSTH